MTTYSVPQMRSSSATKAVSFISLEDVRSRLDHHPVEHALRLEEHQHGHDQDHEDAPLEHLAEELALLSHHPHGRGADREVLRRDHLAEHTSRAVARREQDRVE